MTASWVAMRLAPLASVSSSQAVINRSEPQPLHRETGSNLRRPCAGSGRSSSRWCRGGPATTWWAPSEDVGRVDGHPYVGRGPGISTPMLRYLSRVFRSAWWQARVARVRGSHKPQAKPIRFATRQPSSAASVKPARSQGPDLCLERASRGPCYPPRSGLGRAHAPDAQPLSEHGASHGATEFQRDPWDCASLGPSRALVAAMGRRPASARTAQFLSPYVRGLWPPPPCGRAPHLARQGGASGGSAAGSGLANRGEGTRPCWGYAGCTPRF